MRFWHFVGWFFIAFGVFMLPLTIMEPEPLRVLQNVSNFVLGLWMVHDGRQDNPC